MCALWSNFPRCLDNKHTSVPGVSAWLRVDSQRSKVTRGAATAPVLYMKDGDMMEMFPLHHCNVHDSPEEVNIDQSIKNKPAFVGTMGPLCFRGIEPQTASGQGLKVTCPSYLSLSRRSSPSLRWSGSGTRRARSWGPVPPAAGCGRWIGPDTSRAARWAAPAAPPSDLERGAAALSSGRVLWPKCSTGVSHLC